MHSELELKACPFCGCSDIIASNVGEDEDNWFVGCMEKQCGVNPGVFCPDSEADAIAMWNRREASTQSTGGSEAKPAYWHNGAGQVITNVEKAATTENDKIRNSRFDEPLYTSPPGGSEAVGVKAPIRGPTYYTEGKDADWFEQLDDTEFAKRASYAAMDIVDGDFARIEDYIPVVAILGGAADRIRRLLAAAPPEGIAARDAVIEAMDEALRFITNIDNAHRSVRLLRNALRALRSPASSKDGNHA